MIKAENCYECYWDYYDEDYTDCVWYYCRSEIINKESLFSGVDLEETKLDMCDACAYYYSDDEYYYCIYEYCKAKILDKAKLVAVTTPNRLKERKPMMITTCAECYIDYYGYFYDCIYYYCKTEAVNKKILMSTDCLSLSCGACNNYSGVSYNNCVYYFCKSEIESTVNSLYSEITKKEISLGYCQDDCYMYYYTYGYDYGSCVDYYCKALHCVNPINCKADTIMREEFLYSKGLVNRSNEKLIDDCEACYYYYTNADFDNCVEFFCEEKVKDIGLAYFEGKLSLLAARPEIKLNNCEMCADYYSEEALEDCIYYYCKSELLDKSIFGSKNLNEKNVKLELCTDECYYSNDYYYDCIYYNCRSEVQGSYKLFSAKNSAMINAKIQSKLNYCESCYSDSSYECYWYYCRSQIVNKEILLSEVTEESKCYECYYYEDFNYYDCAYSNCKQEILNKARLFDAKNEISNKLFQKKIKFEDQVCEQYCYYEWYYNDWDYYQCYLDNCPGTSTNTLVFSKVPELLKEKNEIQLDCYDDCYYYSINYDYDYYDCVWYNCKSLYSEKLKKNAIGEIELTKKKNSEFEDCDYCLSLDFYQDEEHYECTYWYCKNEIMKLSERTELKKSQYVLNENNFPAVNTVQDLKKNILESCFHYFYKSVTGFKYADCYVYYYDYQTAGMIELKSSKVKGGSYGMHSVIGISTLVIGVLVYIKYLKKKIAHGSTADLKSTTSYKRIL